MAPEDSGFDRDSWGQRAEGAVAPAQAAVLVAVAWGDPTPRG